MSGAGTDPDRGRGRPNRDGRAPLLAHAFGASRLRSGVRWGLLTGTVAVLLVACGGSGSPQSTSAADGGCGEERHPPPEDGGHLLGEQEPPVPYRSTPPTSGWHTSGHTPATVRAPDDPLSEPRQVSVLEAGGVVVTYRQLSDAERATLERHVRDRHPGTVAVTPYEELEPGEVAFTAWGLRQRCEGVDTEALDEFVAAHAEEDPDRGH